MTAAVSQSIEDLRGAPNAVKVTRAWQEQLWAIWATPGQWPGILDVYEAAAYRRVSHATIRGLCTPDRKQRAKLPHQRFGAAIRIAKADLDAFGRVASNAAAA